MMERRVEGEVEVSTGELIRLMLSSKPGSRSLSYDALSKEHGKDILEDAGLSEDVVNTINLFNAVSKAKTESKGKNIKHGINEESGGYYLYDDKNMSVRVFDEYYQKRFGLSGKAKILECVCGENADAKFEIAKKNYEGVMELLSLNSKPKPKLKPKPKPKSAYDPLDETIKGMMKRVEECAKHRY
jgi:hypothetical protein